MGDQRQLFRFRLPWLSAAATPRPVSAPRPVAEPQPRPAAQTQAPAQPTTTIPIQRPPSAAATPRPVSARRPAAQTQAPAQPTTTIPIQRPPSVAAIPHPISAPRPAAEPQPRSVAQIQAPAQPTTTIPIQRPPFRPVGIGSVQTTPTRPQAPPQRTKPQPTIGTRAATEPKATSQPASPPRLTNQIRASLVPPSPNRRATETQVTSQPVSPSRRTIQTEATSQTRSPSAAPTQATVASMPPSPTRIASQPQPTVHAVSKQLSPSRLTSQPAGQTSSQPSSPSLRATQVQTLSQPKKSPMARQEGSKPPSSTRPLSSTSQETTIQPSGIAVKPSQASDEVKEVAPVTAATTETPSAPRKLKKMEERKKVAEERMKGTTKGPTHEEPEQRTITKLLAAATEAGRKTREPLVAASETIKRHQEKQEDIERRKTWTTSSTDEKQIKIVSSTHPKDWSSPTNFHQKHVISNWEQVPLHKEIREDVSKFVHNLATGQPKLLSDEKSISVLTLAGENRGAYFQLGSESTKKDGSIHIHRGYKINPDDSPDATTDGEGSSKGRKPKDSMTKENPAPRAYVNSNTQSINNSIVLESSVKEKDPGVHLEFLHNLAESTKSSTKADLETRKAEFNITPVEKLTYEPTVRRRCLRGLFAEPSDSDPDNPEKPRRHGCRYSCGEKNKEKEIGIF
ncbi:hypothetical protein REPUB_Repub02eG0030800 [Reevesia pubescens]